VTCDCGCGLEGEDEVMEWLLAEVAFFALEVAEAQAADERAVGAAGRHEDLRGMALRVMGRR